MISAAPTSRFCARGQSDAPEVAAFGEALAYRSAALSGAVEASAIGFTGRNLKMTLDRTTLTGSLAFTRPVGGEAGRLTVDLASDSLDVDSLPSLGAEAKIISDLDLSLSLKAGSLHIARVGEAEIDSGSMSLKATKRGPNVTLERLSVAGLDGPPSTSRARWIATRLRRRAV